MKYFLIFLMDGKVLEISSSDDEDSRNKTFEFWSDALLRNGGAYKRDFYQFNELQTLDQVW